MRFRIVLLGAAFCLGAFAQSQPAASPQATKSTEQSANRIKQPSSTTTAQSVKGCVDQQDGHYVMRVVDTSQIITLQAPGPEDEWFARYVGHQVQASGDKSSGTLKVANIHQIADMCGTGN
jgi:hypothetical protein